MRAYSSPVPKPQKCLPGEGVVVLSNNYVPLLTAGPPAG
uniref:Uncharacterized protein n=1 Tax=Rhizophora mucronata TaxID=61149 RepID=A0A2P2QW40_RHIMU